MVTRQEVRDNEEIRTLIEWGDKSLAVLGYTDHGPRHMGFVSRTARNILMRLGYPERTAELAAIAGWVHDVGNCVNRLNHGITGAALVYPILRDMGMPPEELAAVLSAVGNHEEQYGYVVSGVAAAVIIADKVDTHRTRVRRNGYNPEDIHDRVNYAIERNRLLVDPDTRIIRYEVTMRESSSVMEFLEIYMPRMLLCEQSAHFLNCAFDLVINGQRLNNQALRLESAVSVTPAEEE